MGAVTRETGRLVEVTSANDVAGALAALREHPALKAPLRQVRGFASTGFASLDELLDGGFPAGVITELVASAGGATAGRTSIAIAAASAATRKGELVAWVDASDSLDPRSLASAGAVLDAVLWIRPRGREALKQALQAADLVLSAGGFGVLVLDLVGSAAARVPGASWVRLSHRVGTTRTALVVLAADGHVGTQAHLRLACRRHRGGEVEVAVVKRRGSSPGGGAHVRLGAPID